MDMDARPRQILDSALKRLLRPIVRILLKRSISCAAFEELVRQVYVDVAMNEFGIDGRRVTMSRASVLTGLSRKEVQRLWAGPPLSSEDFAERYNRAVRVLTAWSREAEFSDGNGQAVPLPFEGPISFSLLCRQFSGDMPPKAVLDELIRVGAVEKRQDDLYAPTARGYVPQRGPIEKLRILGTDVADLVETIERNVEEAPGSPYFQRKVMYDSIPLRHVARFRQLSSQEAQRLLERLDQALNDMDQQPRSPIDEPAVRLGMGIYYFEESAQQRPGILEQ